MSSIPSYPSKKKVNFSSTCVWTRKYVDTMCAAVLTHILDWCVRSLLIVPIPGWSRSVYRQKLKHVPIVKILIKVLKRDNHDTLWADHVLFIILHHFMDQILLYGHPINSIRGWTSNLISLRGQFARFCGLFSFSYHAWSDILYCIFACHIHREFSR